MKRPQTLFFIHGKIFKKSKIVYRVRNNRQQCYILNHSTPNSEKQLLQQTIFGLTSKTINRELANPEQEAYWQNIATLSNIKGNTARKAAYAHHSQLITTQQTQLILAIRSISVIEQPNPTTQTAQPTHHKDEYKNEFNDEQLKTLTLISYQILRHYKTTLGSQQAASPQLARIPMTGS